MNDFHHSPQGPGDPTGPTGPDYLEFGDESAAAPSTAQLSQPRVNRRRAATVAGGVAVLALGAGALSLTGIATAATPSPSATSGTQTPGVPGERGLDENGVPDSPGDLHQHFGKGGPRGFGGGFGGGFHGGPKGGFGFGPALHSQAVIRTGTGTYSTVDTQVGTVSAVSSTSITVKSEDGFSKTYAVTADTLVNAARDGISTIKVGAIVNVYATESGGTATAKHIADKTLLDAARPPRPAKPGAAASPAPTS